MSRQWWVLPLLWLGVPGQASAHIVSSRLGDFYGGALHPLTALPDIVLWLALGLLAALQPRPVARWLVPLFPAGLLAGLAAGLALGWTADPLLADAALMVLLGGLTALGNRIPGPLLLALGFAVACYRGLANVSGLEPGTDATLFACGFVAVGYAVMTLVAGLGLGFRDGGAAWRTIAIRAGGSWIAAVGLMVGGFALAV